MSLAAVTANHWGTGAWVDFRTLMISLTVAAWVIPLATRGVNQTLVGNAARETPLTWSAMAVRLFAIAAVIMALGSASFSPNGVKWAIVVLLVIAARNVWIAWYERRRGSLWLAAVLFNIAATMMWYDLLAVRLGILGSSVARLQEFFWVNGIALSLMGLVSVWIERSRIAQLYGGEHEPLGLALHRFAAWAAVVLLLDRPRAPACSTTSRAPRRSPICRSCGQPGWRRRRWLWVAVGILR